LRASVPFPAAAQHAKAHPQNNPNHSNNPKKQAHLQELVADKHGSRALLALLAPSHLARYVSPAALAMMRPPARTQRVAAGKADGGEGDKGGGVESDEEADEEEAEEAGAAGRKQKKQRKEAAEDEGGGDKKDDDEPVMVERPLGESKKDPEARRRELLSAGGFGAALVALLAEEGAAQALLRAPGACDVVGEVARGAESGLLWQAQREGVERVHASIVEAAAARMPGQEDDDGEEGAEGKKPPKQQQQKKAKKGGRGDEAANGAKCSDSGCGHDHHDHERDEEEVDESPLLSHYYASRALRRLALASREQGPGGEGARAFVARLWDGALKGRCVALVPTHAAKVVAAVASGGDARVREEAARELRGVVPGGDVEAWAARFVAATAKEGAGAGGGGKKGGGGKAAAAATPPSKAAAGKRKAK
jgi:hypothetical protein